MIHYPIQTLINSGINDILLVCGGNAAGEFLRIIGNGEEFGLKQLHYTYQKEAKGIADALSLGREFVGDEPFCVILADNILEKPFPEAVKEFRTGAMVFLTKVEHPEWYGNAAFDDEGNIVDIIEKPEKALSDSIVAGVYFYDSDVWKYLDWIKPSERGELEITDINNLYLKEGKLKARHLDGWWRDAGESVDRYLETCVKAKELRTNDSIH
jgi:glucose-1-phosphate thymidylyltransferase